MLKTALAAFLTVATAAGAQALDRPQYDVKIEQAVKRIVAKKVGDIRGGVDAGALLALSSATDATQPQAAAAAPEVVDQTVQTASLNAVRNLISANHAPLRPVRKISSFLYY